MDTTDLEEVTMNAKLFLSLAIVLFIFLPASVYADGCFLWQGGADLNEPMQKAIIYFDDATEVLILQVKYEGAAEEFAWVVPLPSRPTITAIDTDDNPFREISMYTRIRRYARHRKGAMMETPGADKVVVLERRIIGVYDTAVLAAREATALANWLSTNGFDFPASRTDVLGHYARKGWFFVAMRIDPARLGDHEIGGLKYGELQAMRFTFNTQEMVYPLKISSVNSGHTEVLLYLLAEEPMMLAVADLPPARPTVAHHTPRWWVSDELDSDYGSYPQVEGADLPITWAALGLPEDRELSVCKHRAHYWPETMTDDLAFARFDRVGFWEDRLREAGDTRARERPIQELCRAVPSRLPVFGSSEDAFVRRIVAAIPQTDSLLLARLAKDPDSDVRQTVAKRRQQPEELLEVLARDGSLDVRRSVAKRRQISIDLLRFLAKDPAPEVRCAVARNEAAPVEVLSQLRRDGDPRVREAAILLRTVPLRELRRLARDPADEVRNEVAGNRSTPVDVLEFLAKDRSSRVRRAVASNAATPIPTLLILARDGSAEVRRAVASHKATPGDVLSKLSGDSDGKVRERVARRKDVAPDVLDGMKTDPVARVRFELAGNWATPSRALQRLAKDVDQRVRRQVARNRTAPGTALMILAGDDSPDVRKEVAWNPNTPVKTLWNLTNDESREVRKIVARRDGIPEQILRVLAEDPDESVSQYAKDRLQWSHR
jgi:hypothetical protein